MPLTIGQISGKVGRLREKYAARDSRMSDLLMVRQGNANQVFPGLFPDSWPKPIVANFCDVAARDLAELIAPLPSFNCSSSTMVSDTARKFADKRTKVMHYYLQHSDVATKMFRGADEFVSYGFVAFYVEPDFDAQCPRVNVEDSTGAYPEFDRWGDCVSYARRVLKSVSDLCAEYPEFEQLITLRGLVSRDATAPMEMIRYCDADQIVLYLPQRDNLILRKAKNPFGQCPVVVAQRPSLDDEMRGQFDDVLWVQIARAKMALYGMEAAQKSVQAPLAVPDDVQEITFGADAVIRSRQPEKIRRVGVELPQGAFVEGQLLDKEMRVGGRYPEARSGIPNASVITGRGIQELTAGFDTQVKTAQQVLGVAFRKVAHLLFAMDEKLWPNVKKNVRGNVNGTPYEITYVPSKDISGDYSCDVQYGFVAGMDPNRAVVFLLQLRAEKLISRDLAQRQLPFDVNVTEEQQKVDVEETRDALKQAVFAYAQAIPVLAEQGADPGEILNRLSVIIDGLQKGDQIEAVVGTAFAPPPASLTPDAGAPVPGAPEESGAGGGPPSGLQATGLMNGVAPGQAGLPPGGRPDMNMLLAGLSAGGAPQLSANVSRRRPV